MTQEPATPPSPAVPHVYLAINRVQAALAKEGVTKSRKNKEQGYQFRGIDEIFNALAPHLAEHGLCVLPRILARTQTERATKSGGALFTTVVEAEYDFIATADGSRHTVRVYGEAMDTADKSSNKAMSAAYKYACLQTFCIPTEGDNDADATTHEVAAPPAARPVFAGEPQLIQFQHGVRTRFAAAATAAALNEAWGQVEPDLKRLKVSPEPREASAAQALRQDYLDRLAELKAKPEPMPTVSDILGADSIPF